MLIIRFDVDDRLLTYDYFDCNRVELSFHDQLKDTKIYNFQFVICKQFISIKMDAILWTVSSQL